MSPPLELRPIHEGEAELALNVIASTREQEKRPLDADERAELAGLPASIRSAGGEFWIYLADGSAIGTVSVRPVRADAALWRIDWMVLLPGWRRMGLGRYLFETAQAHARQAGAASLLALVPAEPPKTAAIFTSLGFAPAEAVPAPPGRLVMQRPLAATS